MTSNPPQSGQQGKSTTPASTEPASLQPTQAATSYANAATKSAKDSTANVSGPAQNEQQSSVSPVTGQPMQNKPAPASGVTIVNGADHARKPSVTITSSGTSGNAPTGTGRPKDLQFGFKGSSPGMSPAAPAPPSQAGLGAPPPNPRVTSPQTSPSPIPQPASSGGRPPSTYQAQGNVPNFGSFGETGDANVSYHPDAHSHWIFKDCTSMRHDP